MYRYYLHLDWRGFCIFGQRYGSIFKKDYFLDTGETLEAKWVLEAVEKAKEERRVTQPLVIHSDRGVQYTCRGYEEATEGMERSYSTKASPWDNACIESFHALIKRKWINRFRIIDYSHAYRLVFEYIEAFYNTVRIHSHCGDRPPVEYEKQYLERMELRMRETRKVLL